MLTQHQQRLHQCARLLAGRHQQRGFRRNLIGDGDGLTRQNDKAGMVLLLIRQIAFQHLQMIELAARLAAQRGRFR